LSAAVRLDRQLHAAASAINASGPPWTSISTDVARKVQAADLSPVARAVPAGLPSELQRSVILVYSDLSSRRHSMAGFQNAGPVFPETTPESYPTSKGLLAELRNGHAAAARFDRDLAVTRWLAAETPPIPRVPKQSRLVAEALLLVRYVEAGNGGCDARGGAVITKLPVISWGPVAGMPEADGTIGGVQFTAKLRANGSWEVYLLVC